MLDGDALAGLYARPFSEAQFCALRVSGWYCLKEAAPTGSVGGGLAFQKGVGSVNTVLIIAALVLVGSAISGFRG